MELLGTSAPEMVTLLQNQVAQVQLENASRLSTFWAISGSLGLPAAATLVCSRKVLLPEQFDGDHQRF